MPLIRRVVRKARPRADGSGYQIAAKHVPTLRRAYEALVGTRLTRAEQDALLNALARGDVRAAVAAIPLLNPNDPRWADFARELGDAYGETILDAALGEVRRLGFGDLNFELDNPYSRPWIQAHVGDLITEVSQGQVDAVRAAVDRGFELGLPPREMARTIETIVGLDERYAIAVMNRLNLHLGEGMDADLASDKADRYAATLLRDRAERIARTETIDAEAEGLLESWRVATDEGYLPPGAQKKWIQAAESERTCAICQELGDMDPIDLEDSWFSSELGEDVDAPTAHPQCRCSLGLVFP